MAKIQLRELWNLEKALLRSVQNYSKLRRERDLGDMQMVEFANVSYDNLGHLTLCLLHRIPQWTEFALEAHRPLIETLAARGSWKAREILKIPNEQELERPTKEELAARFFFGDIETLEALQSGYA